MNSVINIINFTLLKYNFIGTPDKKVITTILNSTIASETYDFARNVITIKVMVKSILDRGSSLCNGELLGTNCPSVTSVSNV